MRGTIVDRARLRRHAGTCKRPLEFPLTKKKDTKTKTETTTKTKTKAEVQTESRVRIGNKARRREIATC